MNDTYKNEVSIYKDYKPTLVKDAHKQILNFTDASAPDHSTNYSMTTPALSLLASTLLYSTTDCTHTESKEFIQRAHIFTERNYLLE